MNRIWNFRTKLVAVLVLVLTGTFLLQTVIHEHNEKQLLSELEKVAQDIANDTSNLIAGRQSRWEVVLITEELRDGSESRASNTRARPPAGRRKGSLSIQRTTRLQLRPVPLGSGQDGVAPDARLFLKLLNSLAESGAETLTSPLILQQPRSSGSLSGDSDSLQSDSASMATVEGDLDRSASTHFVSPFDSLRASGIAATGGFGSGEAATLDITPHLERVGQLFRDSKRHDLTATFGVFLIGIGLAWFLGVRVTRPVDEVVHGFQRLADGDFEARVTERTGAEFGHLGKQFNHMVERLKEGRALERELSQRERIEHMGDLAAGVAHDVRNPLNAIHLNIGQIRDEFVPEDERGRKRFLRFTSDVQREVERLNQLVTNFLSLAQPASETAEPVSPNELVDELFRLLSKEAKGQQVDLVLDLAEELPMLHWNRQEMKSAFLNIAINALQTLRQHGGQLKVATARRSGPDGPELVVTFQDDGPGIPIKDLERVFVPYYTTREDGTGLGMAIARRTAERHHGKVELRSNPGQGTIVAFVFPLQQETVS